MKLHVTVEIDLDTTDRDIDDMWDEIAEAVKVEFGNPDSNIDVNPVNPDTDLLSPCNKKGGGAPAYPRPEPS